MEALTAAPPRHREVDAERKAKGRTSGSSGGAGGRLSSRETGVSVVLGEVKGSIICPGFLVPVS